MSSQRYEVGFPSPRAEKEFEKTLAKASKKERSRILAWFEKLAENPRPPSKSFKFLKGDVVVMQYLAHYRIREVNWRILYDIDDVKRRVVLLALRRRGPRTYD
jgi:mRNA-degrading endonuclease RelE of RelBE toxin-antitoxin system